MSDSGRPMHPLSRTDAASPSRRGGGADPGLDILEFEGDAADPRGEAGPARRAISPRLLWRFKWTIVSVFTVLSASALAAIWTLVIPMYQATARVEVRSLVPRFLTRTEETGQIPRYERYLLSQVAIISDQTVLERVLEYGDRLLDKDLKEELKELLASTAKDG